VSNWESFSRNLFFCGFFFCCFDDFCSRFCCSFFFWCFFGVSVVDVDEVDEVDEVVEVVEVVEVDDDLSILLGVQRRRKII